MEDVHFKECAVTDFLTPINIHQHMQSVFRDECMDVSIVRHGVQQFKQEGCSTRWFREKEKYFFKGRIQNLVEY